MVLIYYGKPPNGQPYSADDLADTTAMPKANLRNYLWKWEHKDQVIKREDLLYGSPIYRLTETGEEYLAAIKRIPARNLRKVAIPTR